MPEILAMLRTSGFVSPDAIVTATALTGGVASDIFRIETADRVFAVKRALGKLKVAADWRVTTDRNAFEVGWLKEANRIIPGCAPTVLFHDGDNRFFAMEYLAPETHPVWKTELRAGRVDPAFAAQVGQRLVAIHAATAGRAEIAARFDTTPIFRPIRLEAYLEAAAARHPGLAKPLIALSNKTAATRKALVHGDVSPKNILVGPCGPVFLDAECAWYGDPAFDIAFCLNHLLLKCLWVPEAALRFLDSFDAMARAWGAGVNWEDATEAEARAAALLPGLFLARIDGKSPVEYITSESDKERVRQAATRWLLQPSTMLAAIAADWKAVLQRG